MKKYWLIFCIITCFLGNLFAQSENDISVSITIPPPYSPYVSEYSDLLNQGIITLTNLTNNAKSVKLVGYISSDNGLEAFTNPNYQPFNPILLNPFETKVILAGQENQEYLDANNISYNASQQVINNIQITGILPEGNYQICVRALDFNTNEPLSPEAPMGCVFFPVMYVQPPFLTSPMCEDSVDVSNNMMVLNWLPVSAATPQPIVYDLYIVQLMFGQNPNDAIMGAINFGAGNPIIKLGLVTNSAITLPSDLPLQSGQWYAWAVVARDPSNTVVIENNGRSEVCTFYVNQQDPIAGTGAGTGNTNNPIFNNEYNLPYQGLPISTITGQLDYRFHGDNFGVVFSSDLFMIPQALNFGSSLFNNTSNNSSAGGTSGETNNLFGDSPSLNDGLQYIQTGSEPPVYILPLNYNPSGGQPLSNTQLKFTMRYAVGKTSEITSVNDLEVVDMEGWNYNDYRYSMLGQNTTVNLGPSGVTVGVTTTDTAGYFTVHIPVSEHFGLIQSGQVTLHYGSGDLQMSKTGFGLYRLVTMEILDDRFCHPDAYLFPKPNTPLNLPKQISVVKSYNLKVLVKSKEHGQQQVGSGGPIRDAIVQIGRVKSAYDALPANYPKGESKIYQFGQEFGTSGPVKLLCDSGITDIQGAIVFTRLVRPLGNCSNTGSTGSGNVNQENVLSGISQSLSITDGYYIEAESHPFIGNLNYNKTFRYNIAPCPVGINSLDNHGMIQHRSHNYQPMIYTYTLTLTPKMPEIYASTRADYGTGPFPVPHTNLLFHVSKPGQPEILVPFQTDQNGFFKKQLAYSDVINGFASFDNQGFFSTKYKMYYNKPGYNQLQCVGCTAAPNGTWVALKMGERWRPEAMLQPKGLVKGIVRDEAGNPIEGEVKIGDGIFLPLEMLFTTASGPIYDNGMNIPIVIPTSPIVYNNSSSSPTTTNNTSTYTNFGGSTSFYNPGTTTQNTTTTTTAASGAGVNLSNESGFHIPAQSGTNIMVVIRPYASNLFQDTFYVDIPVHSSGQANNLGIFIVRKKLHRPVVTVNDINTNAVISGAQVILSDLPAKVTNSQGKASFIFPSPANEFRLQVIKNGYALYDEHVVIPVSKVNFPVTVSLQTGHTINGIVKDLQTGTPLPGARVHCVIGVNTYGGIIVETFANSSGSYALPNIPSGYRYIHANHTTPDVTYIGKKTMTNIPRTNPLTFLLQKAPFHLPLIWNLPVEISSFSAIENGWKVSGAFVNIPENARFKVENSSQRLSFSNVPVVSAGNTSSGQPLAVPTANSININITKFRSILNNQHYVSMTGASYTNPETGAATTTIKVEKSPTGNGEVKVKAQILLEAFKIEYQYNSELFIGESANSSIISAFKGSANNTMPEIYKVMDLVNNSQPTNPEYTVHEFNAFADKELSYLRADSIILKTKLKINLPLSNPSNLEIDAGNIVIMPDAINIFPGSTPLKFKLEEWEVESNSWSFDASFGGIVTSGLIKTDLIHFNAPQIIIRPNELILPNSQAINSQSLTLSGITPLILAEGVNLNFSYYNSPQHDPQNGHWRIALFKPEGHVAHIKNLPGWTAEVPLNIQYIENFSDGFLTFSMMPNQQINHYNVIKQNVTHIFKATNGFAVSGTLDLEIPNLIDGYSGDFIYYKDGANTKVRLDGLTTNFETYGQVHFLGDQQGDRIFLDWNILKVPGRITIYDDQAPNTIQLRAMLIKQPNDIRLNIFKTDQQGILEGDKFQYISLGGGNSGRQKVLEGSQLVQGNSWQKMRYFAQWEGFNNGIKEGKDKMWFEVAGAITNDSNSPDQMQLADVDTPFGNFSLAYIFSDMSIFGSLTIENMPLGGVYINEGGAIMQVGGKGFYLTAALDAMYPGIGQLNTNFIAGSYPNISPEASQLLKQGMYLQKLPPFLNQSGIQGLYICANKSILEENFTLNLFLFEAGFYFNTGIDARFWLNMGNYGGANIGGLIYADVELYARVVVCDMCFGLLGEVGIDVGYQWNPDNGFTGEVCGSVMVNMGMCGATVNESVKLTGTINSNTGVDVDLEFGENCGNPISLNSNGCKHF